MFEIVAWDQPGAGVPMLATLTPQAAIAAGLPRPSQCDVVVAIFWSRMGTPLPDEYRKPDGTAYLSGTEWEYLDALGASERCGKPAILVYRRTEKCLLDQGSVGVVPEQAPSPIRCLTGWRRRAGAAWRFVGQQP